MQTKPFKKLARSGEPQIRNMAQLWNNDGIMYKHCASKRGTSDTIHMLLVATPAAIGQCSSVAGKRTTRTGRGFAGFHLQYLQLTPDR